MAQFVRLYNGTDGKSHFEDMVLPFAPREMGAVGRLNPVNQKSAVWVPEGRDRVTGVFFEHQVESFSRWHLTRQRHIAICLEGEDDICFDLESGDGERRLFRPGDVLLQEDMAGEGHTGHRGNKPRTWLALMLGD